MSRSIRDSEIKGLLISDGEHIKLPVNLTNTESNKEHTQIYHKQHITSTCDT